MNFESEKNQYFSSIINRKNILNRNNNIKLYDITKINDIYEIFLFNINSKVLKAEKEIKWNIIFGFNLLEYKFLKILMII